MKLFQNNLISHVTAALEAPSVKRAQQNNVVFLLARWHHVSAFRADMDGVLCRLAAVGPVDHILVSWRALDRGGAHYDASASIFLLYYYYDTT